MISIRTDLAVEARELYKEDQKREVPGVEVNVINKGEVTVTKVSITNEEGANNMGKPIGNYITIEAPRLRERDRITENVASHTLKDQLRELINLNDQTKALVIGLGNWNVTPDALGPRVTSKLMVTRHLMKIMPDEVEKGIRSVSTLAPGVLGITGMETSEIVQGVVEKTKPDVIIAIDALASRNMDRISTTIQLADTGISPGSGVGNKRLGLSKEILGVPVIAIGVPTVIDAATLASDTLDDLLGTMAKQAREGSEIYKILSNMDKDEKRRLIGEVASPYIRDLMVTPKEIDTIIDDVAKVISRGINMALHDNVNDTGEIQHFLH
ncbi:MAG: GPR endopeptidase [Mahellales bacterium]